jgi:hypothetical protein
VAGGWRRLHNEELHNLYASPNVIRAIKSGIIRWAEHVARIREKNAYQTFIVKREGKRPFEKLVIDGRIILKWILGK